MRLTMTCVLGAWMLSGATAATAQNRASDGPEALFQTICVDTGGKMEAVEAAARKAGFVTAPTPPTKMTRIVALQRDGKAGRQAVVANFGDSEVLRGYPVRATVHGCAVTLTAPDWDLRGFARRWTGVAPVVEDGGVALYSFEASASGNRVRDTEDPAALLSALNSGGLRTLAAVQQGALRSLSLVVFEAPNPPATLPADIAAPPHTAP